MLDKIAGSMYLPISLLFFCLSYFYFFPSNWMITDAHSYSSQALAFASGKFQFLQTDFLIGEIQNLNRAPYNLGNASYLAIFAFLFGSKNIFLGGLISVIGSAYFLQGALQNWKLSQSALSILFVSAPILFFSRSLMSCMPSLLLISYFLFLFSKEDKAYKNLIIIGLLAGLSSWFRETNIVITGLMSLYLVMKIHSRFWPLLIGGIIGLSIRFISSYLVYGKFFFISASSGFSFESLIQNAPLYLFMSLILVPFGLISIISMKEKADKLFLVVSILFLLIYSSYNYTAVAYSGFLKGSLLTSRFLIPWIPLAIIGTGFAIERHKIVEKFVKYCIISASLLLIPFSQYAIHKLYQSHQKAAVEIAEKYQNKQVVYDQSGFTNIIRYINPVTGDWNRTADISSLEKYIARKQDELVNDQLKSQPIFLALSISIESEAKSARASKMKDRIPSDVLDLVDTFVIDEYNRLEVYQVNSRN